MRPDLKKCVPNFVADEVLGGIRHHVAMIAKQPTRRIDVGHSSFRNDEAQGTSRPVINRTTASSVPCSVFPARIRKSRAPDGSDCQC
jgi:hypothetical protein